MEYQIHKANSRGHANFGWLNSFHTFSFGNYYNPERLNFGALRVLNDDTVAAGMGFGKHPHDNMEIISIPLEGDLEHEDSMGNKTVIKEGDIQVMSAGTGVQHSEYNKSKEEQVKFLQIWIVPNKRNVTPRYDQIGTDSISKTNELYQIVSPNQKDQGVWIHQNAWFEMGSFNETTEIEYKLKNRNNGVYIFVLEGEVTQDNETLNKRDGIAITKTELIKLKVNANSKILLMEVPLN